MYNGGWNWNRSWNFFVFIKISATIYIIGAHPSYFPNFGTKGEARQLHVGYLQPRPQNVFRFLIYWRHGVNTLEQASIIYVVVIIQCRVQYGEYFPSFLYFHSLFHEPSGEWNNSENIRNEENMPYCTRNYAITSLSLARKTHLSLAQEKKSLNLNLCFNVAFLVVTSVCITMTKEKLQSKLTLPS